MRQDEGSLVVEEGGLVPNKEKVGSGKPDINISDPSKKQVHGLAGAGAALPNIDGGLTVP